MTGGVVFLPGAGGSAVFWRPVAGRLPPAWRTACLSWPGLGHEPPDPAVRDMEALSGLARKALARVALDRPAAVVAQSMGGVVAVTLALRYPALVRRLVLVCCSGGVDMAAFGARDWRPAYVAEYPAASRWILDPAAAPELPFEDVAAPTLVIGGDRDPWVPPEVTRHIAARIPTARLHVVAGGGHDLAVTHAGAVAALVRDHLEAVG